ncbi:poly(A)-specific ribonuclease [Dimargaris verticillata]|uniref:Poly(A)-specific ribonuclease n=1 Tax=Dimargaris verticillata TaxID=2761393 RepID=A0A9W8E8P2_9FUNG|nr:poly(A)-specific ribonuclease [Dimargaris verticillata]
MDDAAVAWAELAQVLDTPPHAMPCPIARVAFDHLHELIWVAYANGRITSYTMLDPVTKYTSFLAHREEVVDLCACERGILSASAFSIRCTARSGLVLMQIRTKSSLCSFTSITASPTNPDMAYAADKSGRGLVLDIGRNRVMKEFRLEYDVVQIRYSQCLCTVTAAGMVTLRDPLSLQVLATMDTQFRLFADLALTETTVYACGYQMQQGMLVPDTTVKAFALDTPTEPHALSVMHGSDLLAASNLTDCPVIFGSKHGQFTLHYSLWPEPSGEMLASYQVNLGNYASVTSIAVASSGEVVVFGDSAGTLHIWSSSPNPTASPSSHVLAMPETNVIPTPLISFGNQTPLSVVGLPYYDEPLLSQWPANRIYEVGKPPYPIDPTMLDSAKWIDFVGYVPNPRDRRRNQVPPTLRATKNAPLFRSQQARQRRTQAHTVSDSAPRRPSMTSPGTPKAPGRAHKVPSYYERVEIRYSKFGVEDFDFEFYNRTQCSGLENHILNCYCNPLLQAFFYLPLFRHIASHHLSVPCPLDTCLLCELAFLFRMLADAKGTNCQASNLLQAFGTFTQAQALGLLEPEQLSNDIAYGTLIQSTVRFMLQQFHLEWSQKDLTHATLSPQLALGLALPHAPLPSATTPSQSLVERLFAWTIESTSTCPSGHRNVRRLAPFVIDLMYPTTNGHALSSTAIQASEVQYGCRRPTADECQGPVYTLPAPSKVTFAEVLHASIEPCLKTRAWCQDCRQYQLLTQIKACTALPPLLALNCAIKHKEHTAIWGNKLGRWLPSTLAISLEDGLSIREVPQGSPTSTVDDPEALPAQYQLYDVRALIIEVKVDEGRAGHLIAQVATSSTPADDGTPSYQWHHFNDFLVRPVPEEEVFQFQSTWKSPAVLLLAQRDVAPATQAAITQLSTQIDPQILAAAPAPRRETLAVPMARCNLPLPKGYICALDAEFVMADKAQTEVRSDGSRFVLRPNRMSLGRVSVVRGQGDHVGQPFIDDYVATKEPIFDYLSAFSGIEQGDLDPTTSRKHLLPLKQIYKKLRYLVDQGCVFVGHGLKKDLRIINIFIPKAQVVDTVDLFRSADEMRLISLRFLTWFLLHQDIQQASHCSVQDAQMALKLYQKYCQLKESNLFDQVLDEIYEQGHTLGWKLPDS